jgi:hypothetical protein
MFDGSKEDLYLIQPRGASMEKILEKFSRISCEPCGMSFVPQRCQPELLSHLQSQQHQQNLAADLESGLRVLVHPNSVSYGAKTDDSVSDGAKTADSMADGDNTADSLSENAKTADSVSENAKTADSEPEFAKSPDSVSECAKTANSVSECAITAGSVLDSDKTIGTGNSFSFNATTADFVAYGQSSQNPILRPSSPSVINVVSTAEFPKTVPGESVEKERLSAKNNAGVQQQRDVFGDDWSAISRQNSKPVPVLLKAEKAGQISGSGEKVDRNAILRLNLEPAVLLKAKAAGQITCRLDSGENADRNAILRPNPKPELRKAEQSGQITCRLDSGEKEDRTAILRHNSETVWLKAEKGGQITCRLASGAKVDLWDWQPAGCSLQQLEEEEEVTWIFCRWERIFNAIYKRCCGAVVAFF